MFGDVKGHQLERVITSSQGNNQNSSTGGSKKDNEARYDAQGRDKFGFAKIKNDSGSKAKRKEE